MVAKSQATAAWERRNWVQVTGGAVGCGVDAGVLEDLPDRGCADVVAETDEFAVDAAVAPGRVLGRHVDDEAPDLGVGGRPTSRLGWLGPVPGDASAVPAQQRVGGDEPSVAARPGERLSDGAEQRPVVIGQRGPARLAAQHDQLVAQDDDLEVLGAAGTDGEASQRREKAVQDAIHTAQDRSLSALLNAHVRVSGTHTRIAGRGVRFRPVRARRTSGRRHGRLPVLDREQDHDVPATAVA